MSTLKTSIIIDSYNQKDGYDSIEQIPKKSSLLVEKSSLLLVFLDVLDCDDKISRT